MIYWKCLKKSIKTFRKIYNTGWSLRSFWKGFKRWTNLQDTYLKSKIESKNDIKPEKTQCIVYTIIFIELVFKSGKS